MTKNFMVSDFYLSVFRPFIDERLKEIPEGVLEAIEKGDAKKAVLLTAQYRTFKEFEDQLTSWSRDDEFNRTPSEQT